MRRRRFFFVIIFVILGVLIWQFPALLRAVPSRYVAAYLPESLQSLAEREHVEMLPTVERPLDSAALLARPQSTLGSGERSTSESEPATQPASASMNTEATSSVLQDESKEIESSPTSEPPSATPTPTPLPIAPAARVSGLVHHFQSWNNCGPATLAMALSYFDIFQDQEQTASILKPDPEDRNVSPSEMEDYVNNRTNLRATSRTNGDLDILRRLLSVGLPVIIELGLDPPGEYRWMGWYGHYLLVVAYDDSEDQVWVYDSWFGTSAVPGENANTDGRIISYVELDEYWRQFGRNYVVLYEPSDQATVSEIIGPAMDDVRMWKDALARTQEELLQEEDNAFLWFNLGTAFNGLGDYESAAAAFDQARSAGLPWRMLWYQFGPYEAYYQVGRFEDVILLADVTLMDRPYFEESYYYRGLARAALGEAGQATTDLEDAVKRNPNYLPAIEALAQLQA